jgi:glycosyl transferase family 25
MSGDKQIKIYVINLARCSDRREKMTRMLGKLQLEFEFFDGVDGAQLTPEQISSVYKPTAAFVRLGRELHRNEMACSWSHIRLYEMMMREGIDSAVVLEDDIDLSDEFSQVLAARRLWLPSDWRVVNFAHDMAKPIPISAIVTPSLAHLTVCRFERVVGRTGAYLINKQGAESLLRHAYPVRMPPDDLAGDARFLGVQVYGITPRVAMWDEAYVSAIWTDTTREQFAENSRGGLGGIMMRLYRRARILLKKR